MKKISLITTGIAVAIFSWLIISGFTDNSSMENELRKKIAELEKQLAVYEENAGTCAYKYFDSETALNNFITENYSASFMFNTVAANNANLRKVLGSFPATSTVYISIIQTPKGKDLRLSIGGKICDPFTICCPPNCNPPKPKSLALLEAPPAY